MKQSKEENTIDITKKLLESKCNNLKEGNHCNCRGIKVLKAQIYKKVFSVTFCIMILMIEKNMLNF